jgi:sulfur carrier protein ThiS adenylyltransferase
MKTDRFDILKTKRVGIAGAGGLGSNCAIALARIGVGELVIADFDTVDESNLNRQYYFTEQVGMKKVAALKENIGKVNPQVHVIAHDLVLDKDNLADIFSGCDVIVEAFDLAEAKEMIIETIQSQLPETPLVVGLGVAGWGDNNSIRSRQIGNLYICGDEKTETSESLPPLAPRVGVVASMQANQVVEIILGAMP